MVELQLEHKRPVPANQLETYKTSKPNEQSPISSLISSSDIHCNTVVNKPLEFWNKINQDHIELNSLVNVGVCCANIYKLK